jgi:hypothetical protein
MRAAPGAAAAATAALPAASCSGRLIHVASWAPPAASASQAAAQPLRRGFAAGGGAPSSGGGGGSLSPEAAQAQVDAINELFVAARDEIEYAQEEAETVYFNESVADAKAAVDAALGAWARLLGASGPEEAMRLQRSMGLKMEQLKAEFHQLERLHADE